MGFRVVDELPTVNGSIDRSEGIKIDIRQIIENRIEKSELTDILYSSSYARAKIQQCAYSVIQALFKEQGLYYKMNRYSRELYYVIQTQDDKGNYHYYFSFDPEAYDEAIARAKEEKIAPYSKGGDD